MTHLEKAQVDKFILASFTNAQGQPCAYRARLKRDGSEKIVITYRFKDELQRNTYLQDQYNQIMRLAEADAKRLQEAKEAQKNIKVGDVFYYAWGYEQTNINFFQVVEVSGSFVKVREIEQDITEWSERGDYGKCVGIKDAFKCEVIRKKVSYSTIKMECGYGRIWDGKPTHFSRGY